MSSLTLAAAAVVRSIISANEDTRQSSTVTGLRTPLGETITASVFAVSATTSTHADMRLEIADHDRGDADADLGIIVTPTSLPGIDRHDAEAWNVSMTLPTLLRILGHTTTEKE